MERLNSMLGTDDSLNSLFWLRARVSDPPGFDDIVDALRRFGFDDIRGRIADPASQLTDRAWRKVAAVPRAIAFGWFTAGFNPRLVPYLEAGALQEGKVSPDVMVRTAVFAENAGVTVSYYEQALSVLSLEEILLHWPMGTPIEYIISFRD